MTFTENWYHDDQLAALIEQVKRANKDGLFIEIGCWEGRSTIAIANALSEGVTLCCVDSWQGNTDEYPEHATVHILQERDVYTTFCENMRTQTKGNYKIYKMDWRNFVSLVALHGVSFIHIDASHDYTSVYDMIMAFKPRMRKGGIMCGDDFSTATIQREDLQGGVERAVRELLPGFQLDRGLWYYVNS
jgi:predicted O-methyltransferase YrrM